MVDIDCNIHWSRKSGNYDSRIDIDYDLPSGLIQYYNYKYGYGKWGICSPFNLRGEATVLRVQPNQE